MKSLEFKNLLDSEKNSLAYKNYLEVRDLVFSMMNNAPQSAGASSYWSQELAGFLYMLDASPLIISKLRHHAYHLTGIRNYDYREHHTHRIAPFKEKIAMLKALDKNNLIMGEATDLGGFGYKVDGKLFNIDTLKFYEGMIAMDKAGVLEQFRNSKDRKIVLEIGAGWGGLPYQFKKIFPNTTYVIVDFPSTLLFSATYLKTLFPEAKCLILDGRRESAKIQNAKNYDFIFVPHYSWDDLEFTHPNLLINMASFQEMTTEQVENYVKKARGWGVPNVYSLNRDRSLHNSELSTVSSILAKYYKVEPVHVLDLQYNELPTPKGKLYKDIFALKRKIMSMIKKPKAKSYRHIIASLF